LEKDCYLKAGVKQKTFYTKLKNIERIRYFNKIRQLVPNSRCCYTEKARDAVKTVFARCGTISKSELDELSVLAGLDLYRPYEMSDESNKYTRLLASVSRAIGNVAIL